MTLLPPLLLPTYALQHTVPHLHRLVLSLQPNVGRPQLLQLLLILLSHHLMLPFQRFQLTLHPSKLTLQLRYLLTIPLLLNPLSHFNKSLQHISLFHNIYK